MRERGVALELALAPVALLIVVVAVAASWPALISALAVLWIAPALADGRTPLRLDERQAGARAAAERAGLTTLFVLVCLLPLLLRLQDRQPQLLLAREWADVGFLALTAFWVRAAVFARGALGRRPATHAVASLGVSMALVLCWGSILAGTGRVPPWAAGAVLIVFVPHLLEALSPRLAALAWAAGAGAVAIPLAAPGFTAVEVTLVLLLLIAPWLGAGALALRSPRLQAAAPTG